MVGCTPSTPRGSDRVELRFDTDPLVVDATTTAVRMATFDVADQLPAGRIGRVDITLSGEDVETIAAPPDGTRVRISVTVAGFSASNVCSSGVTVASYDVQVTPSGAPTVSPAAVSVTTAGLATLIEGRFSACLRVTADAAATVRIRRFEAMFLPPDPIRVNSCDQVLAQPAVQSALDRAASNGFTLRFPTQTTATVTGLDGSYQIAQMTTFDPDGTDVGENQNGLITLATTTANVIRRTGFGAGVDFFVTSSTATIGFCTVDRTNDPACDQTIARLETLAVSTDTGVLSGRFLAVALRRERFTNPSCGDDGDFIFGNLTLTPAPAGADLIDLVGPVSLPGDFDPDLLIVSPAGDSGVVTDRDSSAALRFTTVAPLATTTIMLPQMLTSIAGFSAVGISADGRRLALVTDQPDASVAYDSTTLAVVRQTAPTDADYIGGRVDFSPDASRIYVPTTDPQFADRVTILRTDDSPFADEVRRLLTPQGRVPVQARISPGGGRLAILLEAGAPIGQAGELVFVNADTGNVLQRVNLVQLAGGTVLASELVNASDGSRVYLAGTGAVVAVQTQTPFAVTRIDVSNQAGDNPTGLAISGDGRVLAVSVAADRGSIDAAIIDTGRLATIQTFDLDAVPPGAAIGVAHFAADRVAVVAAATDVVVAVQTEMPFAVGPPISVAATTGSRLGAITGGGNVIAVTNRDQRSVYVLRPAESATAQAP